MTLEKRRRGSSANQARQPLFQPLGIAFRLHRAFPHRDHMPACIAQGGFVPQVAGLVSFNLAIPPCAAGFRESEVRAILMSVPEAAVDKDDGAVFRQHDVGFAGE